MLMDDLPVAVLRKAAPALAAVSSGWFSSAWSSALQYLVGTPALILTFHSWLDFFQSEEYAVNLAIVYSNLQPLMVPLVLDFMRLSFLMYLV